MAMTAILSTCGIQRGFHQVLLLETEVYMMCYYMIYTVSKHARTLCAKRLKYPRYFCVYLFFLIEFKDFTLLKLQTNLLLHFQISILKSF